MQKLSDQVISKFDFYFRKKIKKIQNPETVSEKLHE